MGRLGTGWAFGALGAGVVATWALACGSVEGLTQDRDAPAISSRTPTSPPADDGGTTEAAESQTDAAPPDGGADPLDQGLVAHYTFDGDTGSATDRTGNGHAAVALGGTSWSTSCKSGGCVALDGVSGHLEAAHAPQFDFGAHDFTVACWVFLNDPSGAPNVASELFVGMNFADNAGYPGFLLGKRYGALAFQIASAGVSPVAATVPSAPLHANRWLHVAGVRGAGTIRLYLDGVVSSSTTVPDAGAFDVSSGAPLALGASVYNSGTAQIIRFLRGSIDDVRIYDRALTSEDVASLAAR